MDESAIAKLAARQHGVVTARQLHAAGFDDTAIKRRRRSGRLHRLYRGVYLVGHPVAPDGAWEIGALLACGSNSVISHRSAAYLWRLPGFGKRPDPVDVTASDRDPGRKPGIKIHYSAMLHQQDVRLVAGIRTTAPGRTLLDLATVLPFSDLEVAFADARSRRLLHAREASAVLHRHRGRRGAASFRRLVDMDQERGLSRSEAERRLLALVRTAALPPPRTNVDVAGLQVDLLWRQEKVVVEVDGYAFHAGARAFERDRERDATLTARGFVVMRVTWRQIVMRPEAVIARLAAALSVRS